MPSTVTLIHSFAEPVVDGHSTILSVGEIAPTVSTAFSTLLGPMASISSDSTAARWRATASRLSPPSRRQDRVCGVSHVLCVPVENELHAGSAGSGPATVR